MTGDEAAQCVYYTQGTTIHRRTCAPRSLLPMLVLLFLLPRDDAPAVPHRLSHADSLLPSLGSPTPAMAMTASSPLLLLALLLPFDERWCCKRSRAAPCSPEPPSVNGKLQIPQSLSLALSLWLALLTKGPLFLFGPRGTRQEAAAAGKSREIWKSELFSLDCAQLFLRSPLLGGCNKGKETK